MTQRTIQLDAFDRLMLDVAEAERLGVFGSTAVDVESLMAPPVVLAGPTHWYRHVLVGLPLAACIAMFFGVATLWRTGSVGHQALLNQTAAVSTLGGTATSPAERCPTLETLRSCFGGPGTPVGADCQCVDFDDDGDVDLRDMGSFQLTAAIN
jgi:hypothetical protein